MPVSFSLNYHIKKETRKLQPVLQHALDFTGDEGTFFLSLTHSDSVKAFKHFFSGPEKEKAAAHTGCYLGVC